MNSSSVSKKNSEIYGRLLLQTVVHRKGFFILAPSGVGKTYFINHQKEKNWIDGDSLWNATGAHPDTNWWAQGIEVIRKVDVQSDVITEEAKEFGFWILGASGSWLVVPDAVVLPPWDTNVAYIKNREENNYDGGLKTDQLEQLEAHRKEIKEMAESKEVPIFESVQQATSYLENLYAKL